MFKLPKLSVEATKLIFETAFKTTLKMQRANEIVPCIFHQDTNASLSVNVYKGLYHCFACGASGNTTTLLKLIAKGDF